MCYVNSISYFKNICEYIQPSHLGEHKLLHIFFQFVKNLCEKNIFLKKQKGC